MFGFYKIIRFYAHLSGAALKSTKIDRHGFILDTIAMNHYST